MLTVAPEWTQAMCRDNAEPVYHLRVDLGGGVTRDFVKGYTLDATLVLAPNSIAEVSPVASSLDPVTREMQIDSCEALFHADEAMRDLVIAYRLKGKAVTIKIGESNLASANFAHYFTGVVDEAPKVLRDGRVEMKVASAMALLREAEVLGGWESMHPLAAIEKVLVDCGVPSSLYDATTLDPSDSAYADISHWVIQRGVSGGNSSSQSMVISTPQNALDVIAELAELMDGQFTQQEDGILRFKLFDSSASSVATFTHDNMAHDGFEIVATDDDLVNRVSVSFARSDSDKFTGVYVENDTDSQAAYAHPDASERIVSEEIKTKWLDSKGTLRSDILITDTAGDTFVVAIRAPGFCGTNYPSGFPGTRPSWAELTSSNTAFILVDEEIIEVDQATIDSASNIYSFTNYADGTNYSYSAPRVVTYRIKTRGACGTVAAAHSDGELYVYDATIAVDMARSRIRRRSEGLAKLKLKAHPALFYHVQVGDLVVVETDKYAAYSSDGLDSNTKWEVVGKEASFDSDTGITFELAWATHSSPPTPTFAGRYQKGPRGLLGDLVMANADVGMVVEPFLQGGVVTNGGGLVASVAAFNWTTSALTGSKSATSMTMIASRDNYLYLDTHTGDYVTKDVALATSEPSREAGLLALAMVKTGASTITSITDLRATSGIVGGALKPSSVVTGSIADGAVTTGKVADLAIATGKIADLGITTTKVANSAIATRSLNTSAPIGMSLVHNSNFAITSRG
jgi:hypothetical protein